MGILVELPHNDQVDLFNEVKAQLLAHRQLRMEEFEKGIAFAKDNLEVLTSGNRNILGTPLVSEKPTY